MIIGGGIAGLQAAIQLGRYEHKVLVIDAGYGRSTLCRAYHNILGYPDGVSGEALRELGRKQAAQYGVAFVTDEVTQAKKTSDGAFELKTKQGRTERAKTLLLATGVLDRMPEWPELKPCLGITVYICPDCDGYEIKQKKTIVLGAGDSGAQMALTLRSWTDELIYINHEQKFINEKHDKDLQQKGIAVVNEEVDHILTESEWQFAGVKLKSGQQVTAERGFLAFGGNQVKTDLAKQLGVERLENKHVQTDPRTKMTNVPRVWAAGDMVAHAEQVTVAMGEGSQAAIWIHKALQ
ncbi:NAD(P)/FAD-dependent oxidoreductase [Caldalkalibacillus salinus]|uniref:NAD(P)/FAD-dependent oxidoreductase n=1 Tax=Caldalkalibacillus salinus TaxID=2803787 RepID=UPI0019237B60|nr:NAD(P)/FAD-dependent oxidoreductase [Caldalkalibacillus salinus]